MFNNIQRSRKPDPTDAAARSGPDGDEDADPARSRAVRRSQQLSPACSARMAVRPTAFQLRMKKVQQRGTDEDRTFWKLLLNYTKRLRAEERPGRWGVRLGRRAHEEVQGPAKTRSASHFLHETYIRGELKLRMPF
ncbi:hypothetical protein NDU88_005559 [Pleurodeles waltl]|uniref:Uncharacterized protein n=1 Tax=Pleurodeles waltl TaxID=8319 RepID=A0AAV7TUM0_PLEWA|nr:hypothetical protein NDU88_005559 [Pleurodeles waltl]